MGYKKDKKQSRKKNIKVVGGVWPFSSSNATADNADTSKPDIPPQFKAKPGDDDYDAKNFVCAFTDAAAGRLPTKINKQKLAEALAVSTAQPAKVEGEPMEQVEQTREQEEEGIEEKGIEEEGIEGERERIEEEKKPNKVDEIIKGGKRSSKRKSDKCKRKEKKNKTKKVKGGKKNKKSNKNKK